MEMVTAEIKMFATKHEERVHHHDNVEAIQLLDNSELLRWLERTKPFELFHQPTLMQNILYSLTICLLHYYPRHVSSINMPIFRRKNYIHTAFGIFAFNQCTVQTFTESEDTRCCVNTIFPPEDGHVNARNMSRIIV